MSEMKGAMPFDRLPPHSEQAEACVLGCVLLGGRDTLMEAQDFIHQPADFYDLRHRKVWVELLAMDERGSPPDMLLLQQALKDAGQLEAVGGAAYLSGLPDAVPSAANLEYYGAIVREKAAMRRMLSALSEGVSAVYETAGPAFDVLDAIETRVIDANSRPEDGQVKDMKQAVLGAIDVIEQTFEHRNKGLQLGMSTGFGYYDKVTTGLRAKQLTLIGGRPGTGKTSFAVTMILNLALRSKISVGFLSMEMNSEEIVTRMLCSEARANMAQLHSGMISERHKQSLLVAARTLAHAPIFIDDTPALTPAGLRMRARRLVARYGVKVLVIDHLHEMADPVHKGDEAKDAKAAVVAAKWCARVLGVPVVALAQLNREFEKEKGRRPPRSTDLRGHGANEQVADIIGILSRDYDREAQEGQETDEHAEVCAMNLNVVKQRNGPTGRVEMVFDRPTMRYYDATYNTGSREAGEKQAKVEFEM